MLSQLVEPVVGLLFVTGFLWLCRQSSLEDVRDLLGEAFTLKSGRHLPGRKK